MSEGKNMLSISDSNELLDIISNDTVSFKDYEDIIKTQQKKIMLLEESQKNLENQINLLNQKLIDNGIKSNEFGVDNFNVSDDDFHTSSNNLQNINTLLEEKLKVKSFNENITSKSISIFKKEVQHYKNDIDSLKYKNKVLESEIDRLTNFNLNMPNAQIKKLLNRYDTNNIILLEQSEKNQNNFDSLNSNLNNMEHTLVNLLNENSIMSDFYYNQNNLSLKNKFISHLPIITILSKTFSLGLKNTLKTIKGYYKIKKENLFDIKYYITNNSYLSKSGVDPLLNYLLHKENWDKKPNNHFNPTYFKAQHKDMPEKLNPLIYYALYHDNHNWKTDE